MAQFPSNFLWGAATSAYQVEGNNANSDWWPWEKQTGHQNSGDACRHYERYEADFDLAKGLNHNAHRFSIEWARIEPNSGEFSQDQLQHYIKVVKALRQRGLEPFATLHHFTNPIWLSDMGGWENPKSVEFFVRYSEYVVRALAPYVHYWMTINEPTVYFSHAYIYGLWPPQKKSYLKAKDVHDNFVRAHVEAYRRIHTIYAELNLSKPSVSIAQSVQAYVPCPGLFNRMAARLRDKLFNFELLDQLKKHNTLDFIGINYYSRQRVELQRFGLINFLADICTHDHDPVKKNFMGWDIYPAGLQQLLLELKEYRVPVFITENGICTGDDELRWEYVSNHLRSVHAAMQQGVDVRGYLYWSLLDNFEWDKGFAPRFGLIDINYQTFERTIRESARKLGEVYKTGILK